jgi:hypothetical protein
MVTAPCVIDRSTNCTITGEQTRIYCYDNNYSAKLNVKKKGSFIVDVILFYQLRCH